MASDKRRKALSRRAPDEVLADHLERAARGDLEGDIAANFSPSVVVLTSHGILRGHDGVRRSRSLWSGAPSARIQRARRAVGPYAQVEWSVPMPLARLDGVATYVIRDGWVVLHAVTVGLEGPDRPGG